MNNFIVEKISAKPNKSLKFRFPPEPNGHLHIGHAKSICLNFGLGQLFNAPVVLRMDDTNPSTEKEEYVNSIKDDIRWLGFNWSEETRASDHFKKIYDVAVDMILSNKAYVDLSTSEEIAAQKGTLTTPGIESEFRGNTVNENFVLFEKMKNGAFKPGDAVLRAKIDMAHPNILMRDPIIYRINNDAHHASTDWIIYPMYDFAHPLCDAFEGISDSICTLEFEAHRELYDWFIEGLGRIVPKPEQIEFSRLNIEHFVMSKRFLKRLVDEKYVTGWDDPRMPTITGFRRGGYTPTAIKNFIEKVGVTRNESVISLSLLEECLRDDLNKKAHRLMAVTHGIRVSLKDWPNNHIEYLELDNNPEDESMGKRIIPFSGSFYIEHEDFMENPDKKFHRLSPGNEVRLKGAYIIRCEEIIRDEFGYLTDLVCSYDKDSKSGGPTASRKVKGTIHWVDANFNVRGTCNEYNKLFLEAFPDPETAKPSHISLQRKDAYFERAVIDCKIDEPIQFMRKGYYVRDSNDSFAFNKTVSLKDSYGK